MVMDIRRLLAGATCTLALLAGAVDDIFRPGEFFVGCNYWGAKAGIHMWNARHWDAAEIERDLAALARTGVEVIRVFPTWSDFQPLVRNKRIRGEKGEFLNELTDLPVHDPLWLEPGAVERLKFFCDTARKHNIKIMLSLVTG